MTKSAIAILTFNRAPVLQTLLVSLKQNLPDFKGPIGVFDDCSTDGTAEWVRSDVAVDPKPDFEQLIEADRFRCENLEAFLGRCNLGVAGNTNRAIRWFMDQTDCEHLLLLNDDLTVLGDFVSFYRQAHVDLGCHLFCFCDFTSDQYKWSTLVAGDYRVKILTRMTGIMMSMTRELINRIGYFDCRFGKFGEEHCQFTVRAKIAGMQMIGGIPQHCVDVEHRPKALLQHQEAPSTMDGADKSAADVEASEAMQDDSRDRFLKSFNVPFGLKFDRYAGAYNGVGIQTKFMQGYAKVVVREQLAEASV